MRALLALGGAASVAPFLLWAQEYPSELIGAFGGGDSITMTMVTSDEATVTYSNNRNQNSFPGNQIMQIGNVLVHVWVSMPQGTDSESFRVEVLSGHVAIEPERFVPDGDSATVRIVLPMY